MEIQKSHIKNLGSNCYFAAFLLILILASLLRFHELGQPYLWQTEIHTVWPAMHFLEGNGFSTAVGSSQPYLRAWMTSTLPVSISFAFLGYTEFAARLPSVMVGISTIVVAYLLAKELGGQKLGIISSAILAVDFWVINWHTQARMYAHNQFFYVLAVFLLFKWYKSDKLKANSKYFLLILPVGILGYHNHMSFLGLLPSFGLFLFFGLLIELKDSNLKKKLIEDTFVRNHLKWGISGFSLGVIYLALKGIPHWFLGYTPSWYTAERGFFYFLNFLNQTSNLLFLFGVGFFLILRKKENLLVALAFLIPFVVQSILAFKEPRLIFHLYPLYVIIASVPLVYLTNIFESLIKSKGSFSGMENILTIAFALVLVVPLVNPLQIFWVNDGGSNSLVQGSNHRGPVNYIEGRMENEDVILSSAPSITGWYMGRDIEEIDYDLNYRTNENASGNFLDPELGIRAVKGEEEMRRIIEDKSGWVIADDNFYTDFKINTEVRRVIVKNAKKIENESWQGADLYRFK